MSHIIIGNIVSLVTDVDECSRAIYRRPLPIIPRGYNRIGSLAGMSLPRAIAVKKLFSERVGKGISYKMLSGES